MCAVAGGGITVVGGVVGLLLLGYLSAPKEPKKPEGSPMPEFVGPPTPKRLLPQRDTTSKPRPGSKEPRKPVFTDADRKQAAKKMKELEAQEDKRTARHQTKQGDGLSADQIKLAAQLGGLVDSGVFYKAELKGISPEIYTGRRFDNLNIDQKDAAVRLFWELCHRLPITVKDGSTGKDVGRYDLGRLKMK